MSQENVVPFDPSPRGGMARRGAPDKTTRATSETVELECPRCAAVLCLEAELLSMSSEILCVGCDCAIPLRSHETVDLRR